VFTERKYSRFEHILACGREAHHKQVWCVMFTVYIDDSGTSPDNRVAVAAAWIGACQPWLRFETEWKRAMAKEGFKCFHASICAAKNRKSEFAEWDDEKQRRVLARLRQVTRKYATKGLAFGVCKKDYNELVAGELREILGRNHYTFAIRSLFGLIENWRAKRAIKDKMEFIFDWIEPKDKKRKEIELAMGHAEQSSNGLERYGVYEGCYSFRKLCDVVQLQAADLLAWLHFQNAQLAFFKKPPPQIAVDSILEFTSLDKGKWVDWNILTGPNMKKLVDSRLTSGMTITQFRAKEASAGKPGERALSRG
jgi:hypothetical protein